MNSTLWMVFGLLLNVVAVLMFVIIRRRLARCPDCGRWQKHGRFCLSCGSALELVCPNCSRISNASDMFCPNCGTSLNCKEDGGAKA